MVQLKDGRQITIDLDAITITEMRQLLEDVKLGDVDHKADEYLAKCTNLSMDELNALGFKSYRKLAKEFWEYVTNPFKDDGEQKNSPSESI